MKRFVFTALLLVGGAFPLLAHKYHASLTQVEWNQQSNSLEVVVRVFADDLELAVSHATNQTWRLDHKREKPMWAYLQNKLVFKRGEKPLVVSPVGMENDVHQVWLYLEIPASGPPSELVLHNRLFIELYNDQVNTVNVTVRGETVSKVFDLNHQSHALKGSQPKQK